MAMFITATNSSRDYFVHRKGVEATRMVGLDGGRVLDSLHAHEKTTEPQPPQRRHQQLDFVSVYTRNGFPPFAVSPYLQPTTTTNKRRKKPAEWGGEHLTTLEPACSCIVPSTVPITK